MNALAKWHQIAASRDVDGLADILAEECVFFSPVVHTPQEGKALTTLYLTGAMSVFNESFRYVKEVATETHAVLEFECEVDGLLINGVDIMTFDSAGQIIEFKVMVRPLKAINLIHAKMRDMLETLKAS